MTGRLLTHFEHYTTGAYAPYVREHRLAGLCGHMLEVAQPPGDFSDPPTSDLVVIHAVSDGIRQQSDLGGGRFEKRCRAGDLFIIPPATATDILVHDDHTIRCLAYPAAMLRGHLEEARPGRDPFDFGRLHAGPFRNAFVLSLLDRLWAEAERGDPVGRLFADGAVLALTAELVRESGRTPHHPIGGLADWQVRRARDLMTDRLADELPLAVLAAAVELSPYHFARAFKESTGLPPHRYQVMLRLKRAKELLAGTRLNVTEIAHTCGFASSQHMATVFRRMVGTTPSTYRREQRS